MEWIDLRSRLIGSVAYNRETETLHVWLRSRRHVTHSDISEATFRNLVNAESAGFYYSYYIAGRNVAQNTSVLKTATKLVAVCAVAAVLFSASATEIANATQAPAVIQRG
jgi:surface polysaccharide O-acyltransferase-like enzyme